MGYEFDNSTQFISYGAHTQLYQAQNLSIGFWIKFLAPALDNKIFLAQHDAFPIISCNTKTTISDGYGVIFEHVKGGGFSFGVTCLPGTINPIYKLLADTWLYFGCTRYFGSATYQSYFGTRSAMVDGQSFTWLPGQEPFPITQPGQTLGVWAVGAQANGVIVGPAYYSTALWTKQQHLDAARCTPSTSGLIWWTKMTEGAFDIGPDMWPNTFAGTPLPTYVPDDGCASFDQGRHYRLYTTG